VQLLNQQYSSFVTSDEFTFSFVGSFNDFIVQFNDRKLSLFVYLTPFVL